MNTLSAFSHVGRNEVLIHTQFRAEILHTRRVGDTTVFIHAQTRATPFLGAVECGGPQKLLARVE